MTRNLRKGIYAPRGDIWEGLLAVKFAVCVHFHYFHNRHPRFPVPQTLHALDTYLPVGHIVTWQHERIIYGRAQS
jgi:hypothetical protein